MYIYIYYRRSRTGFIAHHTRSRDHLSEYLCFVDIDLNERIRKTYLTGTTTCVVLIYVYSSDVQRSSFHTGTAVTYIPTRYAYILVYIDSQINRGRDVARCDEIVV